MGIVQKRDNQIYLDMVIGGMVFHAVVIILPKGNYI